MKPKLILCLALVLSGLSLKADDNFYVTMELDANEISEGVSNFCTLTNIQIAETNFGVLANGECMTVTEYKSTKWTNGETHVSTPLGAREFRVIRLTDPTKTPYEDIKIRIVVFQDGQPQCQFDFTGYKDFDADWIDEKVIKIVFWPGTRVRVVELVNVETGKVIYRSAAGIYDRLESPSPAVKNKQHI
jgi:hypothetical protein